MTSCTVTQSTVCMQLLYLSRPAYVVDNTLNLKTDYCQQHTQHKT